MERPRWYNGYWYKTQSIIKEIEDDYNLSNEEVQERIVQILEEKVDEKQ